jgi:hypothetical protein
MTNEYHKKKVSRSNTMRSTNDNMTVPIGESPVVAVCVVVVQRDDKWMLRGRISMTHREISQISIHSSLGTCARECVCAC